MDDDLQAVLRPGSAANPFVLKDSPPKPKTQKKAKQKPLIIFKGPPSSIVQTRGLSDEDMAAVKARIRMLEADSQPEASSSRIDPREERGHRRRAENVALANRAVLGDAIPRLPRSSTSALVGTREGLEPMRSLVYNLGASRQAKANSALGWRRTRVMRLSHRELWQYGTGPPTQLIADNKIHQQCGICRCVKSHPVSYTCGHSHCYVCIRMWLERKWTCPECVTVMDRAPFRQYAEEAAIAFDYPEWEDRSVVDYSFDGLVFPKVE
ncbi:hypothetical protein B0H15DRAFT_942025 [Mycena belliarum]|uniref:RING-type domain-containing protein n=1 Tax=Mycena belliarum TaxID=1033014 RepID=A0AAD6UI91_9AGAR|nr:hypothetical protein B0H15DRAFT_942025 [Mycena belliae]